LIGRNILDCHPSPRATKTQQLLGAQATNAYTIEKHGVKKLIFQAPGTKTVTMLGLWNCPSRYRSTSLISFPRRQPHRRLP